MAPAVRGTVRLLLVLALATAVYAQKPRWTDAAEYDLGTRISAEKDPSRQIELLREWESLYPTTEFEGLRLLTMASAYKRAGQPSKSFAAAEQLLKLDPANMDASYFIVSIAPSLDAPSPDQIRITREAAQRVLLHKPRELKPPESLEPQRPNAETREADEFIREIRRGKQAVDPQVKLRSDAERALQWAERFSR